MLSDANNYIIGLRKRGDTDAAGLVVCVDCDHAASVASYMSRRILGRRPVFACSRLHDPNDPTPANAIRRFSNSQSPWMVAVNMVSEGIDIPRLRAVVYLTNRLTLLSFRQIVGRVVRSESANSEDHGRVYIPADPRLLEMALHVTDEVDLLPPPIVIVTEPKFVDVVRIEGDGAAKGWNFETIETVGVQGAVFDTSGRSAESVLVACARLFIEREGLTATDPESLALAATETADLRDALLALRGQL